MALASGNFSGFEDNYQVANEGSRVGKDGFDWTLEQPGDLQCQGQTIGLK
jgi:hypothetical protein